MCQHDNGVTYNNGMKGRPTLCLSVCLSLHSFLCLCLSLPPFISMSLSLPPLISMSLSLPPLISMSLSLPPIFLCLSFFPLFPCRRRLLFQLFLCIKPPYFCLYCPSPYFYGFVKLYFSLFLSLLFLSFLSFPYFSLLPLLLSLSP